MNVIARHGVAALSVAATTDPIAAAEVAAAAWEVRAEVEVVSEAEVFEEVVAGANGTVAQFRAEVASRCAGRRLSKTGRCQARAWYF